MKKVLLTVFLCSTLFLVDADFVSACSCAPPSSPKEEMKKTDAVFRGTVVNIDTSSLQKAKQQFGLGSSIDPVEVRFDVSEVWKGPKNKSLEVETARSSASCGYNFEQGKEYLVYANETDSGLNVSLCSRTNLASQVEEDINKLGKSYHPEVNNEEEQDQEELAFNKYIATSAAILFIFYLVNKYLF